VRVLSAIVKLSDTGTSITGAKPTLIVVVTGFVFYLELWGINWLSCVDETSVAETICVHYLPVDGLELCTIM